MEFLGVRGDVQALMREAEDVVHRAEQEASSWVLVEARPRPTLRHRERPGTGPQEIVENGVSGLLVSVGDAPADAEGLRPNFQSRRWLLA